MCGQSWVTLTSVSVTLTPPAADTLGLPLPAWTEPSAAPGFVIIGKDKADKEEEAPRMMSPPPPPPPAPLLPSAAAAALVADTATTDDPNAVGGGGGIIVGFEPLPYEPRWTCALEVKGQAKRDADQHRSASFIRETCVKLHLSGEQCLAQFVLEFQTMKQEWCRWLLFLKQEEDESTLMTSSCGPLHHYHQHHGIDLATLSIYKSFQAMGIARSLKEIARVSGANTKRVWKMQRRWDEREKVVAKSLPLLPLPLPPPSTKVIVVTPRDLLLSRLGYLGLQPPHMTTYQHVKRMDSAIQLSQTCQADFAAHTVAATLTWHYLQSPLYPHKKPKVAKRAIAELYYTTAMSVLRYEKYLSKRQVVFFPSTTTTTTANRSEHVFSKRTAS